MSQTFRIDKKLFEEFNNVDALTHLYLEMQLDIHENKQSTKISFHPIIDYDICFNEDFRKMHNEAVANVSAVFDEYI